MSNALLGTGKFAAPPAHTPEYRRGYLCGIVRGDVRLGLCAYSRSGRGHGEVHLALTDFEALRCAEALLEDAGVETTEFALAAAGERRREMRGVRASARSAVESVSELIAWPIGPSDDWRRGYLAGVFDAEGSGNAVIRISNCEPVILGWTTSCLRHFGFDVVEQPTRNENGPRLIRIRGGLRERLRFSHTIDPASAASSTSTAWH